MDILVTISSLLLLLSLIFVPVIIYIRLKRDFLNYFVSVGIITAAIICLFGWWTDYSNQLLMINYGYDFEAFNNIERFGNVEEENLEKVKQLEMSYFGIGWPLKAIFGFVSYSPYLLIVYFMGVLIDNWKIPQFTLNESI